MSLAIHDLHQGLLLCEKPPLPSLPSEQLPFRSRLETVPAERTLLVVHYWIVDLAGLLASLRNLRLLHPLWQPGCRRWYLLRRLAQAIQPPLCERLYEQLFSISASSALTCGSASVTGGLRSSPSTYLRRSSSPSSLPTCSNHSSASGSAPSPSSSGNSNCANTAIS